MSRTPGGCRLAGVTLSMKETKFTGTIGRNFCPTGLVTYRQDFLIDLLYHP